MEINKATEKDFDEITAVWEASVRATHDFLPETELQYLRPLVRTEFLPAVQVYHIRQEQDIVAFLGVLEDKIEMLFVHPAAMKKGYGRQLLRFAIDDLQMTKVDVNEQNPNAVGFYLHAGFKLLSRSPLDSMGKPFPILHLGL
ncbi:GNAT family N-acetyltransferase [Chitinophaga sp. Mgbs1]|uniref:GNAT family N-acetyltransferase n=1 Tax=Chitinophaga solisilvae TaxID=1233460 RepID=A0A3S1BMG5_9BACT|nr:GNAT family N-acetyltransferase [Chitinophaga solisilvae]